MGSARILYGLERDGLFLPVVTKVNKGGTPHVALAIKTIIKQRERIKRKTIEYQRPSTALGRALQHRKLAA